MKLLDIIEDVSLDITYHKHAVEIVNKIVQFFMNSGEYKDYNKFKFSRFGGMKTVYLWISSQDMGINENFRLLITGKDQADFTGSATTFENSDLNCITLVFPNKKFPDGFFNNTQNTIDFCINEITYNRKIHSILKHEFIHMFDNDRNPSIYSKNSDNETTKEYFNNPSEFNAFYHNVVEHLMSYINTVEKSPDRIDELRKMFKITNDFKQTIKLCLDKAPWIATEFFNNLTSRNKQALYKRLYKLYDYAIHLKQQTNESFITEGRDTPLYHSYRDSKYAVTALKTNRMAAKTTQRFWKDGKRRLDNDPE